MGSMPFMPMRDYSSGGTSEWSGEPGRERTGRGV